MKRAGKDQPTTETYESLVSTVYLMTFLAIKVECELLLVL